MDFKWETESFFFCQGFLSRTLTTHKTAGKGRGPIFIPLYHFHSFTNIQTFICNFSCEITITYILSHHLYLPGCYSMRFTTLSNYYLIEWWCDVDCCLFACWFNFRFCYGYLTWETGGLEFASTIIHVLQANRLTKSVFSQNQRTFFQFSTKGRKDLPQLLSLVTRL